ncbi:hypothetical protein HCG75_04270 [Clostridium sp. K12(2020)]|nr:MULTISPECIES: hypothetical protein [unclassified Clostridium]MBX9136646.1 hypothetical protein [Clostridium sp. K12(2020)]MBX9144840.1 hypothetical protein [Clostridium sp. K13]
MNFKHKISKAEKPFKMVKCAKNDVEKVNKKTVKAIKLFKNTIMAKKTVE